MGVNVQKKGKSVDVAPDDIEDLAEVPSPDDGQRMGYVGTRMTQSECKEALSKLKMPKHTKPRARDVPASSNLSAELYVTPDQLMPAAHNHAPKHGRRSARACTAHVTNNTTATTTDNLPVCTPYTPSAGPTRLRGPPRERGGNP